jgi:very-short-patch-repair endonuclease
MPHSNIDPETRKRAKSLRRNMTDAELRLWCGLREILPRGIRLRRQAPIGPYVVDFACLSHRLVIEVDGGQHGTGPIAASDLRRTEWLESQGYQVLRFWNSDILGNLDGVLQTIQAAIEGSPR